MGAESKAERRARYELKLLILRRCFIILMNFKKYFSLVSLLFIWRILVLALKKEE